MSKVFTKWIDYRAACGHPMRVEMDARLPIDKVVAQLMMECCTDCNTPKGRQG